MILFVVTIHIFLFINTKDVLNIFLHIDFYFPFTFSINYFHHLIADAQHPLTSHIHTFDIYICLSFFSISMSFQHSFASQFNIYIQSDCELLILDWFGFRKSYLNNFKMLIKIAGSFFFCLSMLYHELSMPAFKRKIQ